MWAFGCCLSHMGSGMIPYQQLELKSRKELLDTIRKGEVSPLELLFSSKTPKVIVDIAKTCCVPDPAARPPFETIATKFTEIVGGPEAEKDPRPLVRIKNKMVSRTSFAGESPGQSGGEAAAAAPTEGFMHNTYKAKFKNRGSTDASGATSPRGTEMADKEAAPSESTPSGSGSSSPSGAWFDTFSSTILETFTPGKKKSADADEYV